jgi:ferredoxin--NADP+ reductase
LATEAPWKRFRNVVLVHAVRHANELVYQELIASTKVKYITMVSRQTHQTSLAGRIPAALADGRLESAAGLALKAENSQVMLCGNPDMLKDTQAALAARGLRKHRRRSPGQVTVESFW